MSPTVDRRHHRERGQVIVLFALALVAILAMVALIFDGGRVYTERRRVQNAADAAALAGSAVLDDSSPPGSINEGNVQTAACKAAGVNGYGSGIVGATCGSNGSVVRVHVPSSTGGTSLPGVLAAFEGPGYVQVTVTSTFTPWIAGILGLNSFTTSALGVAVNVPGHGVGYTLLVLDPSNCGALTLNDSQTFVHGGGVLVNSNAARTGDVSCTSKNAAVMNGNGSLLHTDVTTGSNNVVGLGDNYAGSSQAAVPLWTTQVGYQIDPLAGVHVPTDAAAWSLISGQTATAPNDPQLWTNSGTHLFPATGVDPGVVYGGISVGNGDHLILNGGTYIMAGGGFNISNGGDVSAKKPLTIIITYDPSCNSNNSSPCLSTGSGAAAKGDMPSGTTGTGQSGGTWGDATTDASAGLYGPLKAQTTAAQSYLNGILIYVDRDVPPCSGSGNTNLNVGGGGSFYFDTGSIIYAPCSTVKFYGNNESYGGAAVAWQLSLNGSGKTLNLGGPGVPIGSPSKSNLVQ